MLCREDVARAVKTIRSRILNVPEVVVVLGSGLGAFVEPIRDAVEIPYGEIPRWPVSTAPGHAGKLVSGLLGDTPVLVMQGRVHFYEGYSPEEIVFPVRVFGELGVPFYFATNASGGVSYGLSPGDLVVVHDHINLQGYNPLRGKNEDSWGPRFPDMTCAYDRELIRMAEDAALETGIQVKRGVYAAFPGPSFETPAEIRMLRVLGADLVGMSTVPEVIAARHIGMRVCVISCVANLAAGMTENPLTHEEVLEEMGNAAGRLVRLVQAMIGRLGARDR
ncbi:MAG TPA: purine-nucleoside phosphorylase [Synergistales bacterium]|jgi:purine-nucleoside phosphorylase|nr:purine-nucleoside phosphorylase [Synergistales bacterium]MDD3830681.1 purine-nucleoside phosphorylase [Synergistales bacterium]MDY0179359.1 purine-nucleoside phosphorylase [Synergistaceae bacterium]HOI80965.1 purine-nucleoside phosphorylase [Synergistales bacterium]